MTADETIDMVTFVFNQHLPLCSLCLFALLREDSSIEVAKSLFGRGQPRYRLVVVVE